MANERRRLPNRVTPFGEVVFDDSRGGWFGNRGNIHGRGETIVRPWGTKRWIICVLEFKERRRNPLFQPGKYTELFFLDEATAFAAGHRPCFECRREDAKRFVEAWKRGNPTSVPATSTSIDDIDEVLHAERTTGKPLVEPGWLPPGTMVSLMEEPGVAYLWHGGKLHRWSFQGYGPAVEAEPDRTVRLITPRTTVNAFERGYTPQVAVGG